MFDDDILEDAGGDDVVWDGLAIDYVDDSNVFATDVPITEELAREELMVAIWYIYFHLIQRRAMEYVQSCFIFLSWAWLMLCMMARVHLLLNDCNLHFVKARRIHLKINFFCVFIPSITICIRPPSVDTRFHQFVV